MKKKRRRRKIGRRSKLLAVGLVLVFVTMILLIPGMGLIISFHTVMSPSRLPTLFIGQSMICIGGIVLIFAVSTICCAVKIKHQHRKLSSCHCNSTTRRHYKKARCTTDCPSCFAIHAESKKADTILPSVSTIGDDVTANTTTTAQTPFGKPKADVTKDFTAAITDDHTRDDTEIECKMPKSHVVGSTKMTDDILNRLTGMKQPGIPLIFVNSVPETIPLSSLVLPQPT